MKRLLLAALVTCMLGLFAAPAHAQTPTIELSGDGQNWNAGDAEIPLVMPDRWVPGDGTGAIVWVRNASAEQAVGSIRAVLEPDMTWLDVSITALGGAQGDSGFSLAPGRMQSFEVVAVADEHADVPMNFQGDLTLRVNAHGTGTGTGTGTTSPESPDGQDDASRSDGLLAVTGTTLISVLLLTALVAILAGIAASKAAINRRRNAA